MTSPSISSIQATTPINTRDSTADAARAFGKTPAGLIGEIQDAAARMLAAAATAKPSSRSDHVLPETAPVLRAPDMAMLQKAVGDERGTLTDAATLTLLMSQLQELLSDVSLDQAKSRLANYLSIAQSRKDHYEKTSAQLKAAEEYEGACLDDAEKATVAAEAAKTAAEAARHEAERLNAALAAADPADPGYAELVAAAKAATAKAELAGTAAAKALSVATDALEKAGKAQSEVERIAGELNKGTPLTMPPSENRLSNAARLTEILAQLNTLISENSTREMQGQLEVLQDKLQALQALNKKRSEEFAAAMEKAAQTEKTMGCVGKIVAWAVTIVAVVAAPFTGGASLALAAVGLALMITEEVTGFSVLGKAFEPLAGVLQSLMTFIGGIATSMLEGFGVESEKAKQVGMILGAVIGAVLMVAVVILAVVVGKSAGAKLADKFGAVLMRSISKIVPDMVKTTGRAISNSMTKFMSGMARFFGTTQEKMAVRASYATSASAVAQFTNQAAQGVGGIVVAQKRLDASEILAALQESLLDTNLVQNIMNEAIEQFSRSSEVMKSILLKMSDVQQLETAAGRFVLRNIRA